MRVIKVIEVISTRSISIHSKQKKLTHIYTHTQEKKRKEKKRKEREKEREREINNRKVVKGTYNCTNTHTHI